MTKNKVDIAGLECWITVDNFRYYDDASNQIITSTEYLSWFSLSEPSGYFFGEPVLDSRGQRYRFSSHNAAFTAASKVAEAFAKSRGLEPES